MAQGIMWVGTSPVWTLDIAADPLYAMPLVEEEVLNVAFDARFSALRRLSRTAAVNCTSRVAQRVALAVTGLNPRWSPYLWQPGVMKAPASCANNGVRFFTDTEHLDLLKRYAPELAGIGVMEEFLDGPAYEIDGAVIDEEFLFFHALRQHWSPERDRILGYERCDYPDGMLEAARSAVRALGINCACFCIEFRHVAGAWKVIDAHARLGEDHGLAAEMSDVYPLDAVEAMFASSHEPQRIFHK